MKGFTAGLKVGLTVIVVAIIAWGSFHFVKKDVGQKGYEVFALFNDASGLVDKSRVNIAGLTVGEIKERKLQGAQARVTVLIAPNVDIWSNASIYKKTASLIGEYYLEIDPGSQTTATASGTVQNYLLRDCEKTTGRPDCNRIRNVVESITASDIMLQVNETLPLLREILENIRGVTQGPLQELVKDLRGDLQRNARDLDEVVKHVDVILEDVGDFTHGEAAQDLRKTIENVKNISEGIKGLVGQGKGEMNTTGDKLRRDLDKLADTLDHLNTSLEDVGAITSNVKQVTEEVNAGHGTVGRLLKDETIADDMTSIADDTAGFVRSLTRLQTIVGIRTEYHVPMSFDMSQAAFKTYLTLQLMPRPDKWYLVEIVDDPRGNHTYDHELINVNGTTINQDTWQRTSAFRFSFMFAKRIELFPGLGVTGRIGLKESTGGVGLDVDALASKNASFQLTLDLFDFISEQYPRLKIMAAMLFFQRISVVAGIDDVLNSPGAPGPSGITCGPSTPKSWCIGGRDLFFGAMLTFNDEDLRALLTVGAGAISSGISATPAPTH